MSDRSKRKILSAFIISSLLINVFLLVNVFAIKNSKPYKVNSETEKEEINIIAKNNEKIMTFGDKNLMDTSYELAKIYEGKGDREIRQELKSEYYSLALMEYAKLPKNDPQYVRLKRAAIERIRPNMLADSTVSLKPGDSRKKVENVYGEADHQIIDKKYIPAGSFTKERYDDEGLEISVSQDKVFEVKMCSGFPGSWHGIKIGDSFEKIKALYSGEKVRLPGNNFGYKVDSIKTIFVFVDSDELVDAIKVKDKKYLGKWEFALR